jgi:hypothetical protein
MTRYYTNFETSDIGSFPTGWTKRLGCADTPTNFTPVAAYGSPLVKERELLWDVCNVARGFISMDAVDSDANRAQCEILTLIKRSNESGSPMTPATFFQLCCRGSGTTASANYYRLILAFSDAAAPNTLSVGGIIASVAMSAAVNVAFTPDPTKAYFIRWRISDAAGSPSAVTHQVKVWAEDATEPTDWTATGTDTAPGVLFNAAGWIGAIPAAASTTAKAQSRMNYFSVATNGDTAFKPKTNAEFTTWLDDQSAVRRVLIDMSAKGYASGGGAASPTTFTQDVNAYVANGGFVTQAWDSPASRAYEPIVEQIPTFRRQMSTALSGRADTGLGSFILKNEKQVAGSGGVRDDWLRMKWNRTSPLVWLGDASWAKHDFRLMIRGRLSQPTAPKQEQIKFDLADMLDELDRPLQTSRIASGPFANALKPIVAGIVAAAEPFPLSTSTLNFQAHDGICQATNAFDNASSLQSGTSALTYYVGQVDLATNSIALATSLGSPTALINHGLRVDDRVYFNISLGSPSPFQMDFPYWVVTVVSTQKIQLSATRGGSPLTFNGSELGAQVSYYQWYSTNSLIEPPASNRSASDDGTYTLTGSPTGRLILNALRHTQGSQFSGDGTLCVSAVLEYLLFTRFGLSLNYKDQSAFDSLRTSLPDDVGIIFYDEPVSALDAMHRLALGTNCWYGMTPSGRLQIGKISLPASTSTLDLTESDVAKGSLSLNSVILPLNRATFAVRYFRQQLRNGPLPVSFATQNIVSAPYATAVPSSLGYGTPLDNYPQSSEMRDMSPFDSLYYFDFYPATTKSELYRMLTLYAIKLGIFTFKTRMKAMELKLGQTISLTHPRLGWKQWTGSNGPSPDNPVDFDSTKAVVIGIDAKLTRDPFPVTLTVFRQIPGYYPTADVT